MSRERYWLAAISKEHILRGVKGGFIQVCHGKEAQLKRMSAADWLIVYSSKISMERNEKCQAFTAIGQVADDNIYQHQINEKFIPYRRNVKFYKCNETPIYSLIDFLEFIPDKKHWGYPFRFGFLEINKSDFNLIKSQVMKNEKNE